MSSGSTSLGFDLRSWRTKRVESRIRWRISASGGSPHSGESIVNAPKQEAEGVTIRPFEFRRLCASDVVNLWAVAKSPAFAAIRPQHHCSLGNPTLKPAAVAIRSRADAESGHARSARHEAKMVS